MNENIKAGSDIHAGDGGYSIGTQEKYDEFVKGRDQSLGKMRIRELIKQATECYSNGQERTFDKEKFAELIVRECADIATMNQFQWDSAGGYVLKHFGVEK